MRETSDEPFPERRRLSAMSPRPSTALGLLAVLAFLLLPPGSSGARPYEVGLFDPSFFSQDPGSRATSLNRAASTGAGGTVRIHVTWFGVAPNGRPDNPRNPLDPAYNWHLYDSAVREATARGMRVLLSFSEAPRWAEGSKRPSSVEPGAWKPRPTDVGDFAHALAARYSGRTRDLTSGGALLPRVRHFQIWNEPNLPQHLSPQLTGRRITSPGHYRKMLNAGYRGITGVASGNQVLAAGLAPYGDYTRRPRRVPPARFARDLLCLKSSLRPKRCPNPARLDAFAQNLYPSGGPRTRALNRDDLAVPDVASKLGRPLQAARRTGRVLPAGPKPIWITELGWASRPPSPNGVPLPRQARYLEEALYLLYRQNVRTVLWFRVADAPPSDGGRLDFTGLHFRDGRRKPAYRAYRFPFVTERTSSKRIRFWGRAPESGSVAIQRRTGGGWRTIKRTTTSAQRIYTSTARLHQARRATQLRARIGGESSLTWRQR